MSPGPSQLFEEQPLNLDQDEDLQIGRFATCQPEGLPEVAELLQSLTWPACRSSDRELLQTDFQQWLT